MVEFSLLNRRLAASLLTSCSQLDVQKENVGKLNWRIRVNCGRHNVEPMLTDPKIAYLTPSHIHFLTKSLLDPVRNQI